ncbi:TPA: hypothetical protein ACX4EX_001708 [Yersinia enterocolitica]|uniref:hypothetical protein n=1 Tax=Yersinia enterocolitica TaxID=630 RepID=UPI0005FCF926|nr:hypothetical protein [Yersinia enterocolitica]EKN5933434.1 hypothetical protein [Yersinia enterocolitica]ELX2273941.1 hypothetical protein [Yersinia enterocolitica]CRE88630.1 Uncharacterised protein [Yersinia enterocolitica]HDL6630359.1 hypothetical protein [Yersinia enterocolitica]HDL6656664.1 hypothetical protein [Yersinia enterocolitica]
MRFDTGTLDSSMAETIANLSFSDMGEDDRLQLADHCEAACAGLYDCLDYLGDSLITFANHNVLAFTPASLCQLGRSLNTISSLIPALNKLENVIRADIRTAEFQVKDMCL